MDKLSFSTKSNALVSSISNFIERYCQSHGIESDILNNALVVTDEVISNIQKYSNNSDSAIDISCKVYSSSPQELTLEIQDNGIHFNPLDEEVPDLEIPVEEREIGGLGLYLIKSLTSEQRYQRVKDNNLLQLMFKVS